MLYAYQELFPAPYVFVLFYNSYICRNLVSDKIIFDRFLAYWVSPADVTASAGFPLSFRFHTHRHFHFRVKHNYLFLFLDIVDPPGFLQQIQYLQEGGILLGAAIE